MKTFLTILLISFISPEAFCSGDSLNIETVMNQTNEDVIDYVFTDSDKILVLCKINRHYYLKSLDVHSSGIKVFPLNIKAKKLFRDGKGNLFLISASKAYQIDVFSKVSVKRKMTLEQFKNQVQCIVTQTPGYTLKEKVNHAESNYEMDFFPTGADSSRLYHLHDEMHIFVLRGEALKEEHRNYMPYTGHYSYHRQKSIYENSTDTVRLFNFPVSSIVSFNIDSMIFTFDLWNYRLISYNLTTKSSSAHNLKLDLTHRIEVQRDQIQGQTYLIDWGNKQAAIHTVDLENGTFSKSFVMEVSHHENTIKINSEYLYFLQLNEAGNRKLLRFKMHV